MSSFADAEPRRKSTVTFADDSKSTKKDKKDKKEKKEKKEKKSKKEKDKKSSSKSKESSGAAAGGISEEELFKLSYTLKEPLGSGTFSEVRRAIRKEDKAQVAVKCIRKRDLAPEDQAAIRAEISILRTIHHPNIIDLYEVFNTSEMIYIVTEFVEGGELFNRIVQREFYNEKDAQKVVATIATALDYCHKRKIVHRDLKPENILLTSAEDDSSIKIADFGFAKQVHKRASMQHALQTACGTPGYIAPEILAGVKYGASVDMWSLGVILYILLCGYPPFFHENQDKMFKSISKGEYEFHKEYWGAVSESAKELIRGLLCVDPDQRFTAEEVLKHPWIMEEHDKDITPALTQLREFKNKRRWKTAYNVVNAALTLTSGAAGASS